MIRVVFVFLVLCASGVKSQRDPCNMTAFSESWDRQHGVVVWVVPKVPRSPGVLRCKKGYVFSGKTDIVFCSLPSGTYVTSDPKATCIDDPYIDHKTVTFHDQTYSYNYIKVGSKTKSFDVKYPNISYIITTNYMASKQTPTIRVRVGLVGKANKPVLVNIQQSTESVGFELPMRVVGKGSQELAPLNEHTVELCPVALKLDTKRNPIPVQENVSLILTGGGLRVNHTGSTPVVQVHFTSVNHLQLTPGKAMPATNVDDRESVVYRYNWPTDGSIDEVDILVTHFKGDKGVEGKGADVCAKMSVRSGTCPLEEMGVNELTFTRQAFVTVSKNDKRLKNVKDGFLVVIDVFPDDYRCRSTPSATESQSRTKGIQVLLTASTKVPPYVFIAVPIVTCLVLVGLTVLILVLFIRPLFVKLYDDGTDENIVDVSDTAALVIAQETESLPPFDRKEEAPPKMVDLEDGDVLEGDSDEDRDSEPGSRNNLTGDGITDDLLNDVLDNGSFNIKSLFNKVRTNQIIVNLTQTIGHCSIPLLVFLNTFDSTYIDIQGNLKEHTLDGNLDACYVNSRCAFPANISGYRIPDVSRVVSNIPYLVSGACFYFLAIKKSKVMKPINESGKGVKHDFAIFYALAFITAIIGIASAMYHVCPNQTTSRIDMYFIEILLGYYSLKLYQSRVPDIRAVYYAPAIIIVSLSAIERVLGGSALSWDLIAGFHFFFTFWVSTQLFFMGKVTMNPYALVRERKKIFKKIKESKNKPEFKYQGGFFAVAIAATIAIAATAASGFWTEAAMYNVFALSTDIVIYLMYYIVTKVILRKEKMKTHVVVSIAASCITWAVSFIFFFGFKSIDTSVSPAESRCLNKPCIAGFLDGHDLWHCLSASAIFLTNVMILLIDDDLIDEKTEDTYF